MAKVSIEYEIPHSCGITLGNICRACPDLMNKKGGRFAIGVSRLRIYS
jgi:hypothetical protein